jgi:hypothetical protein
MVTTYSYHHTIKSILISNSSTSTARLRLLLLKYGSTTVWKFMLREHQTISDCHLESKLDGGICSDGKHHILGTRKERSWIFKEERIIRILISLSGTSMVV